MLEGAKIQGFRVRTQQTLRSKTSRPSCVYINLYYLLFLIVGQAANIIPSQRYPLPCSKFLFGISMQISILVKKSSHRTREIKILLKNLILINFQNESLLQFKLNGKICYEILTKKYIILKFGTFQ